MNVMSYLAGAAADRSASLVGAPLVIGLMRQVRARLEGRAGGGMLQPWRDLRKQLRKQQITPHGTTLVFAAAPAVVAGTTLLIAAIAAAGRDRLAAGPERPTCSRSSGLLFLGTVALTLAGIDTGTVVRRHGRQPRDHHRRPGRADTSCSPSSRCPIPAGSANLGAIVAHTMLNPGQVVSPAGVLAFVALVIVIIAETGRLPVDNPATHLELTMVHEAMVLEYAGPRLALVEWATGMRLTVLLALLANLFVPWGIAECQPSVARRRRRRSLAITVKVAVLAGAAGRRARCSSPSCDCSACPSCLPVRSCWRCSPSRPPTSSPPGREERAMTDATSPACSTSPRAACCWPPC